jgi:hypothetical protein
MLLNSMINKAHFMVAFPNNPPSKKLPADMA